jgi:hypothetical protein
LRAEGSYCSLDVLYGGLGIAIFVKKIKKISAVFFSSIFGHQNPGFVLNPDPDTYPYTDSLEMSGSVPTTLETRIFWSGSGFHSIERPGGARSANIEIS